LLTAVRDIWKNPWVTGIAGASAIGLAAWFIAPVILSAIIDALGFTAEGVDADSFGSWFMSLYGGMIQRGSLVSVLQSIGAAGLGALGTISSTFGAAIGVLIGAIGGQKLADYFRELDLNEHESHSLENLVQIDENMFQNNTMIIFTLLPALLYNDTMLKCFFETFVSCSNFAESNLFRFNFKENDLSKLKSEEEKVNHTVYNLLISNYNDKESRVKYFHDDYLIGYDLDLSDYVPSDPRVKLLVEVWKYMNGNKVANIDFEKIFNQMNQFIYEQVKKFDDFFRNFHF
jgi:hypothetical protein